LQTEFDIMIMSKVLDLARNGIGKVEPNPYVGAIITKNNEIIATGFHQEFGGAHAEVNAIKNAVSLYPNLDFENCEIYINLEPCSHFGKTPPCVDLLIEKRFKRVIFAMIDPNPLVAGNGLKKLQSENIAVTFGVLENEAYLLNKKFIEAFGKS
jgi:diaminohydroxyphosphoribosylaminopyrimidine deaminase/5-amino-6-(5-phosphoribosylamino)uracil reductase